MDVSSNVFSGIHLRSIHHEVIKWKHFPRYWPFVRGIHRSRWFPAQRPVTQSFDVFFDLPLNKRLNEQPLGWRFETPSWSLWRHGNVHKMCSRYQSKNGFENYPIEIIATYPGANESLYTNFIVLSQFHSAFKTNFCDNPPQKTPLRFRQNGLNV